MRIAEVVTLLAILGYLALMGWILSEAVERGLLQALWGPYWRYR